MISNLKFLKSAFTNNIGILNFKILFKIKICSKKSFAKKVQITSENSILYFEF